MSNVLTFFRPTKPLIWLKGAMNSSGGLALYLLTSLGTQRHNWVEKNSVSDCFLNLKKPDHFECVMEIS